MAAWNPEGGVKQDVLNERGTTRSLIFTAQKVNQISSSETQEQLIGAEGNKSGKNRSVELPLGLRGRLNFSAARLFVWKLTGKRLLLPDLRCD